MPSQEVADTEQKGSASLSKRSTIYNQAMKLKSISVIFNEWTTTDTSEFCYMDTLKATEPAIQDRRKMARRHQTLL